MEEPRGPWWARTPTLLVATVVMCTGVFLRTGLLSGFSRAVLLDGPGVGASLFEHPVLTAAELLAGTALLVALAWTAPVAVASPSVAAVVLVGAHAAWIRWYELVSRAEAAGLVLALGVVAVLIGVLLRTRERSRVLLAAAAVDRARHEERLDMARELHDVVAHHVSGMLVRAQAALLVAEHDKAGACEMLPGIIDGGTDAMGAMRAMVRTLRDSGVSAATGDLTADLHRLAERSELPVRTNIELTEVVRPELGRSVLRIVQEALTNTRKHAPDATSVEVDVRLTASAVLLSVVDNGTSRSAHSGGFGLIGMEERVHELGGRFFAGATGDGWLVTAELPLEARA
ncbi:signal transduction histidine kinase [Saccharothrix coeruleofusca]|uniref:sensor histidine kinase n=1 Tax=Saccharothrix coeruleofusca TaxID=33919 RepID=UPI001AE9B665|nr:histidine kinase [Saccharothrix coeruleofusca]MBP2337336.1 signal transduction histidine kinase [Saccharothrix coeruleofusca]